ncbi:hypothetical protein PG990_003187 [Apiospora arundinis]
MQRFHHTQRHARLHPGQTYEVVNEGAAVETRGVDEESPVLRDISLDRLHFLLSYSQLLAKMQEGLYRHVVDFAQQAASVGHDAVELAGVRHILGRLQKRFQETGPLVVVHPVAEQLHSFQRQVLGKREHPAKGLHAVASGRDRQIQILPQPRSGGEAYHVLNRVQELDPPLGFVLLAGEVPTLQTVDSLRVETFVADEDEFCLTSRTRTEEVFDRLDPLLAGLNRDELDECSIIFLLLGDPLKDSHQATNLPSGTLQTHLAFVLIKIQLEHSGPGHEKCQIL